MRRSACRTLNVAACGLELVRCHTFPADSDRIFRCRSHPMLALISVQVTAQTPIRGVRTSQWSSYAAVDGSFQCRDGSAKVPIAALNGSPLHCSPESPPTPSGRAISGSARAPLADDYCDCADGSDEPGAAALLRRLSAEQTPTLPPVQLGVHPHELFSATSAQARLHVRTAAFSAPTRGTSPRTSSPPW